MGRSTREALADGAPNPAAPKEMGAPGYQGLFRPLIDAREIRLPIRWLSLANGCHPKLRRRSSRLATVCHAPTGRVTPRLRGRLADLCRLLVTEIHIPLGGLGPPGSACKGSDCENAGPNESPEFHRSLLRFDQWQVQRQVPFQSRR